MKKYHELFMDIAERTAQESNCVKYKTGVVIVKDKRIILQGYNGTIPGFENCNVKFAGADMTIPDNRDIHRKWSEAFEVHSEMNAISYAARKGIPLEGTIMYCTHMPCGTCLKHLIQAGIHRIVYKNDFPGKTGLMTEDIKSFLKYIEIIKYDHIR